MKTRHIAIIALFWGTLLSALLFAGCVTTKVAIIDEGNTPIVGAKVEWIKLRRPEPVIGLYYRQVDGVEIFTFREKVCVITVHPKESVTDAGEVVLGWTDTGEWEITDRGLVAVTAPMLGEPAFFALVRFRDEQALLRMESAGDSPPLVLKPEGIERPVYSRMK
jgi:hypothetical protein